MIAGFELRYLAAVAEGQTFVAAQRTVPWVVRASASRRARALVSRVMLDSSHADDAQHVHRVAYLRRVGHEPANHDDREAVATAFAEHRAPQREARAPWVLAAWVLALTGVAVGALVGWRLYTRRPPPMVLASGGVDVPTPSVVEFLTGADVEVHPLERAIREALPRWVVALDARSLGRAQANEAVAATHAAVLAALTDAGAAPDVVEAMRAFLIAAEEHSARPSGDGDERVTRALVAFDDALARHGVPFYVDAVLTERRADAGGEARRRVLASSFRVRGRRVFRSGARRITSLDLERVDGLSFERTLLGYTRPDVRYALVLTSRVEGFLVGHVLPSIHAADEASFVTGYEHERDTAWVGLFELAAHDVLREEAATVVALEDLSRLAAACTRRRYALEVVTRELERHDWRMRAVETYAFDPSLVRGLDILTPAVRRELLDAQAQLDAPAMLAVYRAYEEAELFSIAQHEAQHRVDYEDDRLVAVPDALADYTGRTEFEDRVNHGAERSNAELSAYLSQIARDPQRARSHVVHVSRFLMARELWGTPESYAALVIFEQLARELGLEPGPLVRSPSIVRAEVTRLFLDLRTRSSAEVAAAATRVWERLYGVPLPELELER